MGVGRSSQKPARVAPHQASQGSLGGASHHGLTRYKSSGSRRRLREEHRENEMLEPEMGGAHGPHGAAQDDDVAVHKAVHNMEKIVAELPPTVRAAALLRVAARCGVDLREGTRSAKVRARAPRVTACVCAQKCVCTCIFVRFCVCRSVRVYLCASGACVYV